eukprot:199539_1
MTNKSSSSIQVYARLRHTDASTEQDTDHYTINPDESSLTLSHRSKSKTSPNASKLKFTFNHIFSPKTTQESTFDECGKPLVHQAVKGYNCTLLAYGQTGSGKTYSMLGPPVLGPSGDKHGLIFRCMDELFTQLQTKDKSNQQHSVVKCSFIEIYQNRMRDLLVSRRANSAQTRRTAFGKSCMGNENREYDSNNQLKIKMRHKNKKTSETFVANLTEEYVSTLGEIELFVGIAKARRATCATWANAHSSRSHWVMIVTIEQKTHGSCTTVSKLNFVDLAGSEKVKMSGVTGNSLQEAKTINKSLQQLRLCINALAQKKSHIPYRDSVLTHLLQDSLGGNTKTSLLITLNMDRKMKDESISSCRFGCAAQKVVNKTSINKRASRKQLEGLVAKLQKELHKKSPPNDCAELSNARKRLIELEKSIKHYEQIIKKIKGKTHEDNVNIANLVKLCDELKREKEVMQQSVQNLSQQMHKMKKNNKYLRDRNDRIYTQMAQQNTDLCQQLDQLKESHDAKFELLMNMITDMQQVQTRTQVGTDSESEINSSMFYTTPMMKHNLQNEEEKREEMPITNQGKEHILELDDNVIEFCVTPQPVVCAAKLMETYFTDPDQEMKDEDPHDHNDEKRKSTKKVTPKPVRMFVKMMRLISPRQPSHQTPHSPSHSMRNVVRHRKLTHERNINQGRLYQVTAKQNELEAGTLLE